MLGKADIERFDKTTNKERYYQLYDAYKLIEYLAAEHKIDKSQLNSTLNVLLCLGTYYGREAAQDEKNADDTQKPRMKEHIEQLTHLAEVLYNETKGKYTISRTTAQTWQIIVDDIQNTLDEISNELTKPE